MDIIKMTFTNFYIETERIITVARLRDFEISELYSSIISTIDNSLLSDRLGIKTWIRGTYQLGSSDFDINSEDYYRKNISFVGILQSLVLDRYDSVDIFYETEGLTVSAIFAEMSEFAGYPISPQYIDDVSQYIEDIS